MAYAERAGCIVGFSGNCRSVMDGYIVVFHERCVSTVGYSFLDVVGVEFLVSMRKDETV